MVPRLGAVAGCVEASTLGVMVTVAVFPGVLVVVAVAVTVGESVAVFVSVTVGEFVAVFVAVTVAVLIPVAVVVTVVVTVLVAVGVPGVDVNVGVSPAGDAGVLLLLQPTMKAAGSNAISSKLPIIFFTFYFS